jgi:hypothetical protein
MRLAQLKIRDAPGPLLPSLKQLRVIEPNESSISQLSLFFTKSLQSLEATGVPEAQQSAFLSFLITLADEAPLLSAITIGPGSFTATCLNACLKFDHLRNLELIDAASSIDFDFLVAIGKLPELEIFILNARTATYISPSVKILNQDELSNLNPFPPPRSPSPEAVPVYPGSHFEPPVRCFSPQGFISSPEGPPLFRTPPRAPSPNPSPKFPATPQPSDSGPIDIQMQSGGPDGAASVGRFVRLRQLDIIGSLSLIRDLYEHVISVNLERLGMTLVRTSAPTSYVCSADVPTKPRKGSKGTKKKDSASNAEVHKPGATSSIDLETHSFFTLVENAVKERWPLTLKGVRMGHLQDYRLEDYNGWSHTYRDPDPIALPFRTFGVLLKHEMLEELEITGWTLLCNSENKHPVDEILQATLINLKKIHLPVGGPTRGIQLVQLLPIVRAFPKLVSLQCGFEQPGNFPIPLTPAADVPLHGLKVLSVGHQNLPESAIDQKQQLRIANFLDILFPNLERIETHAEHHAEVWAYIYELIKMCQVSRVNHANRLSYGTQLS